MNREKFISAVKKHVCKSAIEDVITTLENPTGREPSHELIELNKWYIKQDENSKSKIEEITKEAAESALFGLFCVLDGVRMIDDDLKDGNLKLIYEIDGIQTILSDSQSITELHDIFNCEN